MAQGGDRQFRLDPTHTFVTFEVLHFGTATLRGRFGPIEGQASLNTAAGSGRVQAEIDTAQVSTGLATLDTLLKGPLMLSVAEHPRAYFVAQNLNFDPQGRLSSLRGEFTLRGVSKGLTLTAERYNCYFNPLFRRQVCGGDFIGEITRSDFGITHSLGFVADRVRLLVQVEAIEEP